MNKEVKEMVEEAKALRQSILSQMKTFEDRYNVALKPFCSYVGNPKDDNTILIFHLTGNIRNIDPEMDHISGFIINQDPT